MTKKVTFLILVILFFIGCKKNDTNKEVPPSHIDTCIDRQLPGEYFPAFPTTWWTYRNQQNQLVKFEISEIYEPFYGKCLPEFLNLNDASEHKVYVDGESFYTTAYIGLGQTLDYHSIIYSLIRDSSFICPVAFSKMRVNHYFISETDINTRRVTTVLDTTVTLPNSHTFSDVIIVKEYYVNSTDSNNYFYNDYFAKNIGLIKRDSINRITHDTTQILYIEHYFIGH